MYRHTYLILTVEFMYETDLAFCASYVYGTSAYTEYTQATRHDSKGCRVTKNAHAAMMQSSHGGHYLEFHPLYHSYSSVVLLQTWICFSGRTYLFSETCFSFVASL